MSQSSATRYALYGAAFGLVFPLAATFSAAMSAGGGLSLAPAVALHASTPLLWIIDTIPIWLGLFAWLTGHREDRLQEALDTVRHQAVELEEKAQEAELSLEAAAEMSRLKYTLLTNMGHELRTPLSGIIGFAAVLAQEVDEELSEFVHLIERDGRRLLDTISTILDLAEIDSGELTLHPSDTDVTYTVSESVRFLTPLAREKGLDLRATGVPLRAHLDATVLHRIVTHLVGNAIKFTEAGSIKVETARRSEGEADAVVIRVCDTGVGIPAAFLPHLFDEFRQASDGIQRAQEGSGLGLTVTKRLVELMGGTISVESEEGRGSTFTVCLPPTLSPATGGGATAERLLREHPAAPDRAAIAEM
jgi:signal transduction histidine kinase